MSQNSQNILYETVAQVLLKQLDNWGVKRIYGVVGDAIIGFMDELAKQDQIQFIAVKHESVAAMMASAEAKLTGKLGVCIATMGPGLGNLINGLGDAYLDKAPVLAITGQAPTNKIGSDYKQYIDQQELLKPIAEFSTLLANPNTITDILVKAMHLSLANGAVTHLSIPKDMFSMPTTSKIQAQTKLIEGTCLFEVNEIEQVLATMKAAKKPIILAGIGAKNAVNEIETLAKQWGAGILVSLGAKGSFPNSMEKLLGGIGQGGNPYAKQLFQQADVVLLVGDSWWPEGYVPEKAKIIQIEINKENVGKGVPVEWGILGSAEGCVPLLTQGLSDYIVNEDWVSQISETKEKWDLQNEQEGKQAIHPIHPSRIVRAIENVVQDDAILTLDTGDITVWFNRNFRSKNQTLLFSGKWRTMGFGLPAALAAKLCFPEKQVVAIVGDGGIEMTIADLITAIRYQINITVIIFNNHTLQMEKDHMLVEGNAQIGVELTNPDFTKIAEANFWKGYNVENESDLEKILNDACLYDYPTFVTINTAQIVHPETAK